MKILIVLDNPKRDVDSISLLAAELKKNHDVAISFMGNLKFAIYHYNPDHVILNYLRISNEKIARLLLDLKIDFSVLDTEGGVFSKLSDGETTFTKTLVKSSTITENLKHYFCWGENVFSYLKELKIYPEASLKLTGTSRSDIYHYLKTVKKSEKAKPYVLINTSFPLINPKFSTPEKEKKMLISKFNYSVEYIESRTSFVKKVQAEYIELTIYLAKKFQNIDFVFRPHPFENENYYLTFFNQYPNIKVICEGTVANWINESILLIHFECSTALEAAMLGKQSLSLTKFKGKFPVEETYPYTKFCETFEEIAQIVLEESKQESHGEFEVDFSSIYYKVDGKSYLRIAEHFSQTQNIQSDRFSRGLKIFVSYFANSIKRYIIDYKKPQKKILKTELDNALHIAEAMTGNKINLKPVWNRMYWIVKN